VLVAPGGERQRSTDVPPLEGPPERIAAHLRELAEAGADEAILVADPITEWSIRGLAEAVALAG
jgi:alkanesulfonate monooxygenase SsuD/methylene tetrahydromethanopterin reductase-like flavin-dependent oxidoreductase (luciferase family)